MACKVPSIATCVGGVSELIDDQVTGLLYKVGDIDGMAAGAVGLLKDRERFDAMRDAGRKTAQKRFCSSLVVPHYVRYYESVLAGKSVQEG
jgi:glycosyltransferase involved in cell wall biosynthesis